MLAQLEHDYKKRICINNTIVININIDDYLESINYIKSFINISEYHFTQRIKNKHIQNKFIVQRSILKILLSHIYNIKEKDIVVERDSNGKPFCNTTSNINFNISNNRNIISYIFSMDSPVGIDIENINHKLAFHDIAEIFFTFTEQEYLKLSEDLPYDFYRIWTAKEALLKSNGIGIKYGCKSVEMIDIIYNKHIFDYNFMDERYNIFSMNIGDDIIMTIAKKKNGNI